MTKNIQSKHQKEVATLDYQRLLLIWMSQNPKKKRGLSFDELSDAIGLQQSKPKAGILKIVLERLLITKEKNNSYRLPEKQIIDHMIIEFNNDELKKEAIFGKPPLLIRSLDPDSKKEVGLSYKQVGGGGR